MNYSSLEEALTNGIGLERSFLCPSHDDHNASASVNSVSGLWICYACGARGRADLDKIELDPYLVMKTVRKALSNLDETRHTIYPESWLSIYDAGGPGEYWLNRFDPDTCRQFRLGENADPYYATLPMRDNAGQVLGIIKRSLVPGRDKYRYPFGVDVTDYIFNWHTQTRPYLVVTEGATDAIACEEVGIPAVALYGSRISRTQRMAILKYSPEVIFCAHDQDEDGHKAAERVARAFYPFIKVERLLWTGYKDLAEQMKFRRKVTLSKVAQFDRSGVGSTTCSSSTSTTRRFRITRTPRPSSRLSSHD